MMVSVCCSTLISVVFIPSEGGGSDSEGEWDSVSMVDADIPRDCGGVLYSVPVCVCVYLCAYTGSVVRWYDR